MTACIVRRIIRLIERCGLRPQSDPDQTDPLLCDQALLARLYDASVKGRIRHWTAGHRVTTLGVQVEHENPAVRAGPRGASLSGVSVHASVCIPAGARRQLEKLCRYAARPAVAAERLSLLPDGRLL